jgi:hypothetical protein
MTTPRLTLLSSPSSFWRKTKWLSSLPTALPWFGTLWLLPISNNEIEAERTPVSYRWGGLERIEESAWHPGRKGLPVRFPKMETAGPVSTCGSELLRGWWRPIVLMVSFMIFTASVRNNFDTPSYMISRRGQGQLWLYLLRSIYGTRHVHQEHILNKNTKLQPTISNFQTQHVHTLKVKVFGLSQRMLITFELSSPLLYGS